MTTADLRECIANIVFTSRWYSDTGHRAADDILEALTAALGEDIGSKLNQMDKQKRSNERH